ncbi:hypothetical protein NQ315_016623 [Exocentrus adspersus]|uniref:Uncharacterized protein n=1 Tax=Exocentrus adspersus TaxID=1586481 RepID=A0AAV8VNG8_9CUCU|nr:hypothetical protein NQ315_016623 [Exocentrus adspersus]
MRRFTVLVIALVLAPGLQSAVVSPNDITTFPILINPVAPETRPELLPEVEAVVPELISINPCDECFEYMTTLIAQLSGVSELPIHPALPELEVENPVVTRPVPESVVPELQPLPLPVDPEVETRPIPSEAESEPSLAVQGRPLPVHIIRK